jgi:glutathione S-transferase
LKAIDYRFADWTKAYVENVAKALGPAYAEPAKDVEGYIAYVKGKK